MTACRRLQVGASLRAAVGGHHAEREIGDFIERRRLHAPTCAPASASGRGGTLDGGDRGGRRFGDAVVRVETDAQPFDRDASMIAHRRGADEVDRRRQVRRSAPARAPGRRSRDPSARACSCRPCPCTSSEARRRSRVRAVRWVAARPCRRSERGTRIELSLSEPIPTEQRRGRAAPYRRLSLLPSGQGRTG